MSTTQISTRLRSLRLAAVVGLAVTPALAACGDTTASPPTAEQLAGRLISVETFDGRWVVNPGPDDGTDISSGVIPADLRDMLPGIELCDAASAEARAGVESLTWTAFRQIDLDEVDPIEPPDDRSGHMVFVQEFLTSGDPDELATTFELVRAGSEACFGAIEATEEGPGRAEALPVPEVGDSRFGVLTTIEEAGGWAEWRLYNAFVRDGDVFMSLVIVDIRAGDDVEPYYSLDDIDQMIAIAADTL